MHDIAFIRANPSDFDAAMKRRGGEAVSDHILALDARKREAQTRVQEAQSRRNEASKAIGQAMGQGDKDKAEALNQPNRPPWQAESDGDPWAERFLDEQWRRNLTLGKWLEYLIDNGHGFGRNEPAAAAAA